MNGKEFSTALRSRRRVYGTAHISSSPHWSAILPDLGLDFVFIDTEHIALERTTAAWMCRTYRALNLAPIVRIPAPDPYQASMVLDGGAEGVLAPYIETPEQVRQLMGAVKYRPLKGQRLQRALVDRSTLEEDLLAYVDRRNSPSSLLINIESTPAIEALDEILATGGVDAVIVGPHDLSCSLGVPEQYTHPKFEEAVRTIIEKCVAHGVSMGVHVIWEGIPQQVDWAKRGANVILHSADLLLFKRALSKELREIKQALGDPAPAVDDELKL